MSGTGFRRDADSPARSVPETPFRGIESDVVSGTLRRHTAATSSSSTSEAVPRSASSRCTTWSTVGSGKTEGDKQVG